MRENFGHGLCVMLRLITFDACNTLFRVRGSPGELYSEVAWRFDVKLSPKALNESFKHAFGEFYKSVPNFGAKGDKTAEKWWSGVVKQTFKSAGFDDEKTVARISSTLYNEFSTSSYWQVYPETFDVLEHLRKKGYLLAVISNFDERLDTILEGLYLKSYFDLIVCSFNVGMCKPSPEIFKLVLSNFGMKAEEALHVGDNVELDYKPAVSLGFRSLIVDRFSSNYSAAIVNPEHVTKDLKPLMQL
ncbi:haloacid dehalogenase-like hydrolase domain-containing protein 3 [Montipora foliosa]|uniref:haloacid dehalogenase-like hydrolase domain-containing protein 3 n=1 Tax=Montipora foliosa TaxID=591990 RepID=UPI0035F124CC